MLTVPPTVGSPSVVQVVILKCGARLIAAWPTPAPAGSSRVTLQSDTAPPGCTLQFSTTRTVPPTPALKTASKAAAVSSTLGNAAQLATRIGATPEGPFGSVGLACTVDSLTIDDLVARVADAVDREPLVFSHGPPRIERLAISTGAAGYDLIRAAHEGFAALLTGEPEEPNLATAQELGIHLIAAGHHATERFGVQALAAHLAETFALEWRYHEVENPV